MQQFNCPRDSIGKQRSMRNSVLATTFFITAGATSANSLINFYMQQLKVKMGIYTFENQLEFPGIHSTTDRYYYIFILYSDKWTKNEGERMNMLYSIIICSGWLYHICHNLISFSLFWFVVIKNYFFTQGIKNYFFTQGTSTTCTSSAISTGRRGKCKTR